MAGALQRSSVSVCAFGSRICFRNANRQISVACLNSAESQGIFQKLWDSGISPHTSAHSKALSKTGVTYNVQGM